MQFPANGDSLAFQQLSLASLPELRYHYAVIADKMRIESVIMARCKQDGRVLQPNLNSAEREKQGETLK